MVGFLRGHGMKEFCFSLAAAFLSLGSVTTPAWACSCAPSEIQSALEAGDRERLRTAVHAAFESSELVFYGRVIEMREIESENNSFQFGSSRTLTSFLVRHTWKELGSDRITFVQGGGNCTAEFELRDYVLVMAGLNEDGQPEISICSELFDELSIRRALVEELERLRPAKIFGPKGWSQDHDLVSDNTDGRSIILKQ